VAASLPDTYTTLANLHEAEGRPKDALGFYEKAEAIYEKLAARSQSAFVHTELARTLNNLGLARAKNGQLNEGLRDVERGKEMRERLLSGQPLNIDPRADLARSCYHLARIQILSGAADKAIASIRKAEELYAGIPPKGPEDIYFRAGMKALQGGLLGANKAERELSASERSERLRLADEAMALLKQAVAAGYANQSRFKKQTPPSRLNRRGRSREGLSSRRPRCASLPRPGQNPLAVTVASGRCRRDRSAARPSPRSLSSENGRIRQDEWRRACIECRRITQGR
jgi:tetratricopeptide (TPR) repeat protein